MSQMSTPGRALDRGSARYGADEWWTQRVTALALAPLSVWFAVSLLSNPTLNYATVREWMSRGWNAVPLIVLILVAAQHSYLGLGVVLEDYLHHPGTRIGILLLLRFVHVFAAVGAVFAVLDVAFGGPT